MAKKARKERSEIGDMMDTSGTVKNYEVRDAFAPDTKPAEVCHPGEHLMDELEARNMTMRELQNLSGIYEYFIEDIINGKECITYAIAAGLSKALGTSAEYWMNLQRAWDDRSQS